jgi:hypothetical protein
MVDSFGGSPDLNSTSVGPSTATSVFNFDPSPLGFTSVSSAGKPPREGDVNVILSRLYPGHGKRGIEGKATSRSNLQSRANQLIRASGDVQLVKPQDISIPRFVLASSNTLKGELGLMTEGEEEEARAVTRGRTPVTPPATPSQEEELERSIAHSKSNSDRMTQSARKSFEVTRIHLVTEERYEEAFEEVFEPRVSEMTKSVLRKENYEDKEEAMVPIEQNQSGSPSWTVLHPVDSEVLRMNEIKSPPNMNGFHRSMSQIEMGTNDLDLEPVAIKCEETEMQMKMQMMREQEEEKNEEVWQPFQTQVLYSILMWYMYFLNYKFNYS